MGKEKIENFSTKSYSQDGEDVVLKSFYSEKRNYKGFYVDIGALHPFRFSNTRIFYENGWNGINIDATPNSMKEFNLTNPKDINIEALISDKKEEIIYYIFNEPALNTLDLERANYLETLGYKVIEQKKLQTQLINEILEKNIPKNKKIDFINIDIEGVDFLVLNTLNFDKYAPNYFLIEELDFVDEDFAEYSNSKMYKLLSKKGYKVLAKTMRTVIYGKK